jgi:hypothetical protein
MTVQGVIRGVSVGLGRLVALLCLAACSPSPTQILQQIDQGEAAAALTTINAELAKQPNNPALQLLSAHARLQACAQQGCAASVAVPALLQPVAALLAAETATLGEGDQAVPLSRATIVASATQAFASLPTQPAALLALRASLPKELQVSQLATLWQPAQQALLAGNQKAAAAQLAALENTTILPTGFRYAASLGQSMLTADENRRASMVIALRAKPALATDAVGFGQLLPYLWQQQFGAAVALAALPNVLETSTSLGPLANAVQARAAATELAKLALMPPPSWQQGWNTAELGPLALALQRSSLRLNPNQPQVWQTYLPALVAAAASHTTLPEFATSFQAASLSGPSVAQLGTALLKAARDLQSRPSLAAPLLQLASQLGLPSNQQAELDKLAQTLIVKAATAKDVTATLALALARPQAAANNRQQVVPLLVEEIRNSLRNGQFALAVSTSSLIHETLELPVELGPLVLEEFAATNKAANLETELNAQIPALLLQPRSAVALNLGPLWSFMADYFADTPDVLRGQLNAMVAGATGPYGPSTAMHRLLPLFPEEDHAALELWLNTAILNALQSDATLNGPDLAKLAGNLAAIHPSLPLAPALEGALNRTTTAEQSRALWQAATPSVRTVIRAIRPQFAALMNALDADAAKQPDTAAAALQQLTEPAWLTQATPILTKLQDQLLQVAGTYVPLSAAPEAPLAAVVVAPQGLRGGNLKMLELTFLNRLGTLASTNPTTLTSTPATLRRLTLTAPYSFAQRQSKLSPAVLASTPEGSSMASIYGAIRTLQFKPDGNGTLLEATLENGTVLRLQRVLNDPAQPLLPNGDYALSTALEQTLTPQAEEAKFILPPGSILTLQAAPSTQPASPNYGFTGDVYPLLGTLQHPARSSPISFTGEFDASTLASGLTFSYPLPNSGQAVRAVVKCQTLAGPITCGAHHAHSPRLAYATLMRGLQTQESLRTSSLARQAQNSSATTALRTAAADTLNQRIRAAEAASATAEAAMVINSPTLMVSPEAAASPSLALRPDPTIPAETAEVAESTADQTPSPTTPRKPVGKFINRSTSSATEALSATAVRSPTLDFPNPPR